MKCPFKKYTIKDAFERTIKEEFTECLSTECAAYDVTEERCGLVFRHVNEWMKEEFARIIK